MSPDSSGLDRTVRDNDRVLRFVDAIMLGASIPEAGEIIEVGRSQSYEWSKRTDVTLELARRRSEIRTRIVDHVCDASTVALSSLQAIAANPATNDMARIKAAGKILDLAFAGWEWSLHEDVSQTVRAVRDDIGLAS